MHIASQSIISTPGYSAAWNSVPPSDPTKSYDLFEGDKRLTLFKTLAVDTRAEAAPRPVPTEDKYQESGPSNKFIRWLLQGIIKIIWTMGGKKDKADGIPRIYGEDVQALLPTLQSGDLILNGNNGGLSHLAMYAGDGIIIHSMATHDTMRGLCGAIWDSIKRCFGCGPKVEKTGVLKETLADFLDRFERDTYVVLRRDNITEAQRARGVARMNELVGKPYDYDFSAGDDAYYCTEVTLEFLDAAFEKEDSTVFATTLHNYGIFKTNGIEPVNVLEHGNFTPIAASKSADINFASYLGKARSF